MATKVFILLFVTFYGQRPPEMATIPVDNIATCEDATHQLLEGTKLHDKYPDGKQFKIGCELNFLPTEKN